MLHVNAQHGDAPMSSRRTLPSQLPREETAGNIWFETKWGMTMFVLAACLAASGLILYLAIYMAWL